MRQALSPHFYVSIALLVTSGSLILFHLLGLKQGYIFLPMLTLAVLYGLKIAEALLLGMHIYTDVSLGPSVANITLKKLQTRGMYGLIRHSGTITNLLFWLLQSAFYRQFWTVKFLFSYLGWRVTIYTAHPHRGTPSVKICRIPQKGEIPFHPGTLLSMGKQSASNPAYWWPIWLLLLTLGGCSNLPLGEKLLAQDPDLTYLGRAPGHPQNTLYRVRDLLFTVFPGVFQPSPDSMTLLRHTQIRADETVLDIGTGTGIQAIFAARVTHRVVATDINPAAVENTRLNAYRLGLADRISVRLGDLFSAIGPQEHFDVILFNIEYPNSDADQVLWDVHERFFAQAKRHLNPGGRIYYQFGFARNMARLQDMLARNNLQIVAQFQAPAILPGEQYITCVIQPRTPSQQ